MTANNSAMKLPDSAKTILLVLLVCVISIGSWIAIGKMTGVEAWDHRYYWMFGYPLLIATSFVTAYIDSRKPWLWGILPVLAQAVYVLYAITNQAVVLPLTIALYVVLVVPCVAAAYIGIRLKQRRQKNQ
jgi:hypothetical protein